MKKVTFNRGGRLLSSILIIIVLYMISPSIFTHDPLSARNLLNSLLITSVLIFVICLSTIFIIFRLLRLQYSQKMVSYIFHSMWNELFFIFFFVTIVHMLFMLSLISNGVYSSEFIIKGINFDIILFVANFLVIVFYFLRLFLVGRPKNIFKKLIKELNLLIKNNEWDKIKAILSLIEEMIAKYSFSYKFENLAQNLNLEISKNSQNVDFNMHLYPFVKNILNILLFLLENRLKSGHYKEISDIVNSLKWFTNDLLLNQGIDIIGFLISQYKRIVLENIDFIKNVDNLKPIFSHMYQIIDLYNSNEVAERNKEEILLMISDIALNISQHLLDNADYNNELVLFFFSLYMKLLQHSEKKTYLKSAILNDIKIFLIHGLKNCNVEFENELKKFFKQQIARNENNSTQVIKVATFSFFICIYYKRLTLAYELFKILLQNLKISVRIFEDILADDMAIFELDIPKRSVYYGYLVLKYFEHFSGKDLIENNLVNSFSKKPIKVEKRLYKKYLAFIGKAKFVKQNRQYKKWNSHK